MYFVPRAFADPAPWVRRTAVGAMRLRCATPLRMPPNCRSNPPTLGLKTYPEGYNVEEFGTLKRM